MIAKHDSPASARKPVHGGFPSAKRGLQAGDKVICMEGNPDHFYFAGRFLEVEAATELIRQRLANGPE